MALRLCERPQMQSWMKYTPAREITRSPMAVPYPTTLSAHQGTGKKERRSEKGARCTATKHIPRPRTPHRSNTDTYLRPLKPKRRAKRDSEGREPQERETGAVGEGREGRGDEGGPHALDGAGHDGDGDEAEYDDEDEEPRPHRLHDPAHTHKVRRRERRRVCLMGDVPAVSCCGEDERGDPPGEDEDGQGGEQHPPHLAWSARLRERGIV